MAAAAARGSGRGARGRQLHGTARADGAAVEAVPSDREGRRSAVGRQLTRRAPISSNPRDPTPCPSPQCGRQSYLWFAHCPQEDRAGPMSSVFRRGCGEERESARRWQGTCTRLSSSDGELAPTCRIRALEGFRAALYRLKQPRAVSVGAVGFRISGRPRASPLLSPQNGSQPSCPAPAWPRSVRSNRRRETTQRSSRHRLRQWRTPAPAASSLTRLNLRWHRGSMLLVRR